MGEGRDCLEPTVYKENYTNPPYSTSVQEFSQKHKHKIKKDFCCPFLKTCFNCPPMKTTDLIQTLRNQVEICVKLDGKIGTAAAKARKAAVNSANETIAILTAMNQECESIVDEILDDIFSVRVVCQNTIMPE